MCFESFRKENKAIAPKALADSNFDIAQTFGCKRMSLTVFI